MARYLLNEGSFEFGRYTDESMNILARPAPDGSRFGLIVTRIAHQGGLAEFVEKHLAQHARELPAYEFVGQRETHIDGEPAIEAKFRWFADPRMVFHHLAYVLWGPQVLVFTASSLVVFADECEAILDEALTSFSFRRGE